jgi:hypothetical protein
MHTITLEGLVRYPYHFEGRTITEEIITVSTTTSLCVHKRRGYSRPGRDIYEWTTYQRGIYIVTPVIQTDSMHEDIMDYFH